MPKPSPNSNPILSSANGPAIVSGGVRFSLAEEQALNLLIKRAGGEDQGVQIYKIGWALEDNCSTFDEKSGLYKYDPDKKTPICFHPNQASYHFLGWEPPSAAASQLKGEDAETKGTYNCIFHFLDPKTGEPYTLSQIRVQLVEIVMPVMKQLTEIATASRHGYDATVKRLRQAKIDEIKHREAKNEQDYQNFATDLLENDAPAFDGRAFSAAGRKTKQFSDLKLGEITTSIDVKAALAAQEPVPQPTDFAFSVRSRKKKE